jgi:hypothetical protein
MENVYKVYSGMNGHCMCGCAGKYSYTERGAKEHSPGYAPNINERSVKIITGKLLRNSNTKREDDYLVLEQNGRVLVAWFD